jgi:hypothetical protein
MGERIDIEITDNVAPGIAKKINEIATSSTRAENSINKLKAALNTLSNTALNKIQSAIDSSTNAITKNALAHQKLQTESARTATATARITTAQQQGTAATARAELAQLRLQRAQEQGTQATGRHGASWLSMAGSMAAGMAIYQGIQLVIQSIVGTITGGIKAVDDFVMSNIQMAAVLTSLAKNQMDIPGTYKQARSYAEGLNETLMIVDAQTSLNLQNLQSMTLEMAKQGVTLDTTNKNQIDNFTRIANAVALYSRNGKDERQVRQEISALMRGEVRQGDELAKLLNRMTDGQLPKLLVQWKKNGTVVEEIGKRLSGFGPAAEEINKTWSAATSSMQTSLNLIARAGFTGIVKDLVEYIQESNKWLREHANIIGSVILTGWLAVVGVVSSVWDVFKLIITGLDMVVAGSLSAFLSMLTNSNVQIVSMWDVFKFIMQGLAFVGSVLLPTIVEKIIQAVRVASGLGIVAVSFGALMLEAVKDVALSLVSVGVGLWKGLTGDIDGMKNEFSKIFAGSISESFNQEATVFKGTLKALGEDWKNFKSTTGLDGRLDKFFAAQTLAKKPVAAAAPKLSAPTEQTDKLAESRARYIEKINGELDKQIKGLFVLENVRKIQQALDEYDIQLANKKMSKLNPEERANLENKLKLIQENTRAQQNFNAVYDELKGPALNYIAMQKATNELVKQGAITQEEAQQQMVKANETRLYALDPLRRMNEELLQQFNLIGLNSQQEEIANQMQQISNELLSKGIVLSKQKGLSESIQQRLMYLQQERNVSQELNKIYDTTDGKLRQLTIQREALNRAEKAGYISKEQNKTEQLKTTLNEIDTKLAAGKGSFGDSIVSGVSKITTGYQNVLTSLSSSFGNFFTSLTDGFANSIGRAIVYGENLRDTMRTLSMEIVSGLISSLIKLGIQYVVNAALGTTLASASLVTMGATAAAISTMFATPAALVSLATEGTNSIAAMSAIGSTVAYSNTLSLVGMAGFEKGGYTGDFGRQQVAGVVHGKEFVVNADATARNRDALEAMNRGAVAGPGSSVGKSSGSGITVKIENYGTSKGFEVQQLSETDIRIIAKDEAKQAVYNHTPKVVAGEIKNPNSMVSKSLERNTQAQRRRG